MALNDTKFDIINNAGTVITVPDWQGISYQGLNIIGNKTEDWNASMQENFLKIADRLDKCEIVNSGYIITNSIPYNDNYDFAVNNHSVEDNYLTNFQIEIPEGKTIVNNPNIPDSEKSCTWYWDDGTTLIWKAPEDSEKYYNHFLNFVDIDGIEKEDDYFNLDNYDNKFSGDNSGINRYVFFNEWPTKVILNGWILEDS